MREPEGRDGVLDGHHRPKRIPRLVVLALDLSSVEESGNHFGPGDGDEVVVDDDPLEMPLGKAWCVG
jgi:hypothetical protein